METKRRGCAHGVLLTVWMGTGQFWNDHEDLAVDELAFGV
jgi:hypothetical protein